MGEKFELEDKKGDFEYPIVLFDGVCNLCNSSVDFIIHWESKDNLRFASLQSEFGKSVLEKWEGELPDSIVFLEKGKIYVRSSAALRIAGYLKYPWPILRVLFVFPKILRDLVYDFIAKNRYRWFGKKETCRIPTPFEMRKFLG
ncbi:MAG: hypothetical protein RLZZ337_516 [Bacteroidota bacterium]|jgi:predicted DCC family thiol-disulfide oxidoreductase YuxK